MAISAYFFKTTENKKMVAKSKINGNIKFINSFL